MRDADFEDDAAGDDAGASSPAGAVSHLVRGVIHTSDSPNVCTATTGHKDVEGGDFAEACWLLE